MDLFLYLRTRGAIPPDTTYKRFKREWFAPGRFPKYRLSKPSVCECVQAIHADGGFAVIPHFGHLWDDDMNKIHDDRDRMKAMLKYFRSCGVDGVEMYWYSGKKKTQEINEFVRLTAEPLGFFFTYGSDCHGPETDKYTIEKFSGDFDGFPPAAG